jgi:hypothetical protein
VSDVYGARTIKKRRRRTKAEMEALREALFEIVAENEPATVRGVFYLASSAGVVPKTENEGYRPVQRELLKMRREGLILWGWITDGSRSRFGYRRYGGLESYARQVAANYRRDYWHDSEEYVEVWLEKEALRGVISPVNIEEFGLVLYVTKGQPSVSYLYNAAEDIISDGRSTYVYVLTDWDPGGLRIFDRIKEELIGFVGDALPDRPLRPSHPRRQGEGPQLCGLRTQVRGPMRRTGRDAAQHAARPSTRVPGSSHGPRILAAPEAG